MASLHDILFDFVLPAVLVGIALLIGWWPRRDGRWIGAIAISGGFALADCQIAGTPRWPPGSGDAAFWIVWFTVPTAALGFLDAIARPKAWRRAILLALLILVGADSLLAPIRSQIDPMAMRGWLAGIAAIGVILWLGLETLADKNAGVLLPLLFLLTFAAAAVILGLSDCVKQSEESAALAGLALATVVLAKPLRISADRGMVLAAIVPLLAMFAFVHFYSYTEPPLASVALLILAPLTAWIGEVPTIKRMGSVSRWTMRLIPVLLVLGIAVGLTAAHSLKSTGSGQNSGQDE